MGSSKPNTDTAFEWRDFLAKHPDTEAVQLFITDPSGVARGKTASVAERERLYSNGRPRAGSICWPDNTGTDVSSSGWVWGLGAAEPRGRWLLYTSYTSDDPTRLRDRS